jgi:hypothetical protein
MIVRTEIKAYSQWDLADKKTRVVMLLSPLILYVGLYGVLWSIGEIEYCPTPKTLFICDDKPDARKGE